MFAESWARAPVPVDNGLPLVSVECQCSISVSSSPNSEDSVLMLSFSSISVGLISERNSLHLHHKLWHHSLWALQTRLSSSRLISYCLISLLLFLSLLLRLIFSHCSLTSQLIFFSFLGLFHIFFLPFLSSSVFCFLSHYLFSTRPFFISCLSSGLVSCLFLSHLISSLHILSLTGSLFSLSHLIISCVFFFLFF